MSGGAAAYIDNFEGREKGGGDRGSRVRERG